MTHQMYQALMKKDLYMIYCFFENKYNEPFNDNYYYVMQYYCVPAAVSTELADTCD